MYPLKFEPILFEIDLGHLDFTECGLSSAAWNLSPTHWTELISAGAQSVHQSN